MSKATPDELMADWQDAYVAAGGVNPTVSYAAGWFTVGQYPAYTKVRRAELVSMTRTLRFRASQKAKATP